MESLNNARLPDDELELVSGGQDQAERLEARYICQKCGCKVKVIYSPGYEGYTLDAALKKHNQIGGKTGACKEGEMVPLP